MRFARVAWLLPLVSLVACGGSDSGGDAFAPTSAGGSNAAGSGIAGSGTAGSGVTGGKAGSGTAGSGTAGSGTAGSGTAGSGTAGSGTAGSGTAGSGTAGSGTAGSGTAGTGTAGTAALGGGAGSGTAGTGTAGSGTAGTGTAGSSLGGSAGSGGSSTTGFPTTCADAEQSGSTLGCEFWPTVTANLVWSIFDFAVVVSNPGATPANVNVSRAGSLVTSVVVPAGQASTVYLPWVDALKGPDAGTQGEVMPFSASVRADGGAYRLTSDVPVSAVQHNAVEYEGKGGPPGKSWSSCPGDPLGIGCFSFSNDASLLLPTHALGTSYRVMTVPTWVANGSPVAPGTITIVGTQDGTKVTVTTGVNGAVVAGNGVPATPANGSFELMLDTGDVVELAGTLSAGDLSGTSVKSTLPVQVIGGSPCSQMPIGKQACDHLEETLWPTTSAGAEYVVAPPTGPNGDAPGVVVRMMGLTNGTMLTYSGGAPAGAPTQLAAGQVVELPLSAGAYRVAGSSAFVLALMMPSGEVLDPLAMSGEQEGDPSMSLAVPTARYTTVASFGTPTDYSSLWLDVIGPTSASLTLNGAPVGVTPTSIAGSWGVFRVKLAGGGVYTLESTEPVSAQVMGYAKYTSFMHPAGALFAP